VGLPTIRLSHRRATLAPRNVALLSQDPAGHSAIPDHPRQKEHGNRGTGVRGGREIAGDFLPP